MRKTLSAIAAVAIGMGALLGSAEAQTKTFTIALVPGLTTDAFYITMRKGAEAAAKAVGADLVFQGAPDFNPVTQAPVLDAVIARHPDAILIAPTDKTQMIQPLKKAADAGIPVITVDTFIGTGDYQTGTGEADFPLSYIASDNVLGGKMAARALAKAIGDKGKVYVSNVKPGVSTTDQREEGFKEEMKTHSGITVLRDAVQRRRRQQGRLAGAVRLCPQPGPRRRVRREPVLGARLRPTASSRPASRARSRSSASTHRPRSWPTSSRGRSMPSSPSTRPRSAIFGVMSAYAHLTGQSIPTKIGTGFTVMDKSNIDNPDVAKFIYKD